MQALTLAAGWIVVVFVGLLELLVLWKIHTNKIDLTYLISEENGQASLSRFQFLIFTFVIADGLQRRPDDVGAELPDVEHVYLRLTGPAGADCRRYCRWRGDQLPLPA